MVVYSVSLPARSVIYMLRRLFVTSKEPLPPPLCVILLVNFFQLIAPLISPSDNLLREHKVDSVHLCLKNGTLAHTGEGIGVTHYIFLEPFVHFQLLLRKEGG